MTTTKTLARFTVTIADTPRQRAIFRRWAEGDAKADKAVTKALWDGAVKQIVFSVAQRAASQWRVKHNAKGLAVSVTSPTGKTIKLPHPNTTLPDWIDQFHQVTLRSL